MRPMFACAQALLALGMTLHGCGRTDLARKQAVCPPDGIPVGMAAPATEGEDAQGEHFRLSDYRGKVVVLSFFANF